jgi:predicted DNA-binding protein (MmcQ/YjbR family)
LQQTARDTAAAFGNVSHGRPFTPHLDVWKVRDKVFLIVTEDDPDLQIITVKVDSHRGDALCRDHDSITPGRYFDKYHWISVGPGRCDHQVWSWPWCRPVSLLDPQHVPVALRKYWDRSPIISDRCATT